jgi:hypothetical protein
MSAFDSFLSEQSTIESNTPQASPLNAKRALVQPFQPLRRSVLPVFSLYVALLTPKRKKKRTNVW